MIKNIEVLKVDHMDPNLKMAISIPNIDTVNRDFTIIHKEALQKAYLEKKGCEVDYMGVKKIVKDVRITTDFIYLDLE